MRAIYLAAAMLFALGACAHQEVPSAHRKGYDCNETVQSDGETFSVTTLSPSPFSSWEAKWSKPLGDGMSLEVWSILPDSAVFAESGFSTANPYEGTFNIRFDASRFGWYDELGLKPVRTELVTEVSVGDHAVRSWSASNLLLALRWTDIQHLLEGRGDFTIKLYNSTVVLQQTNFSRDLPLRVESRLKSMYAKVMEKAKNKEHACRAYEYDVIVLT